MLFCFRGTEKWLGKLFLKDFFSRIWKTWEIQHVNVKTIYVKLRKLKNLAGL